MKIFFTKRAERNYRAIKEHITNKWGQGIAATFEKKVADVLTLLKGFPEMGAIESSDKKIRGFQLSKQTRVLYRLRGEKIIILSFFDVRQHPSKKSNPTE